MSRQQGMDGLMEVKNAYFIGNYQVCINEAQNLSINEPQIKLEVDSFLYRSYIIQKKYAIVSNELCENCHDYLKPLQLLVEYFSTEEKISVVHKLNDMLEKDINSHSHLLFLVGGIIYYNEHNYDAALQTLCHSDDLECSALNIQIYLKIDRVDLARKELKSMQEKDEDAILTQLSQAWINIAMGGEKLEDAYYIFQELIDKHGATPLLLNGQATCFIHQGKLDEADSILQQCLSKDINNSDALINFIVLSRLAGKPNEVAKRYFIQLQESHRNHHFVREYKIKESEFDRLALQYSSVSN